MEFKGKTIKGTETVRGIVYIGNLPELYPDIATKATDIYLELTPTTDEETQYALHNYFKNVDTSDAEDAAVWMLLNDPYAFNFNELRAHLAEVTGKPYIRLGEKDSITDLEKDGIIVEDDDFSLNQYLEEMLEKAKKELRREIILGEIAMYAVDPELLSEEDKYSLESGLSYELVIEKLENMVKEEIAGAYIRRLNECRADGADYGLNTAIALAKEKPFKGTREYALELLRLGLLTDIEFTELEKFKLLNQANENAGDMS